MDKDMFGIGLLLTVVLTVIYYYTVDTLTHGKMPLPKPGLCFTKLEREAWDLPVLGRIEQVGTKRLLLSWRGEQWKLRETIATDVSITHFHELYRTVPCE